MLRLPSSSALLRQRPATRTAASAHAGWLSTRWSRQRPFSGTSVRLDMEAPAWRKWKVNPPSAIPEDSQTLASQSSLPSLPVPPLDRTLAKLLASCEPFVKSPEQGKALREKVEAFRTGRGPELQRRLEEHAQGQEDVGNWIAEWWDLNAYMLYRGPVVIDVSYYYCFPRLPQNPSPDSRTAKSDPDYVAASIAASAQDFRQKLIDGALEADKFAGAAVCMESYKWAFNACRIPSLPYDHAVKIREDSPEAQHITVIRKHQIYSLPLPDVSLPFSVRVQALRSGLSAIRAEADAKGSVEPVGFLTASDRDPWAQARKELLAADQANAAAIRDIETSAFVVCLDDTTPARGTEEQEESFYEWYWHGKPGEESRAGNRWWDKPVQYVVTDNGESGIIGEHSCMDGTPTAALNNWLSHRLLGTGGVPQPAAAPSDAPSAPELSPTALPFTVPSSVSSAISLARRAHTDSASSNLLAHRVYKGYGKEAIKKYKTSPDGWVQMVIQLAWGLTMGRDEAPCGTYESAQVRRFKLGRTEVVRTVSTASADWVRSMLDSSPSTSAREKRGLFQAAVASHGAYMKEASAAMGVDRHVLGWKLCLKEGEEVPEVFKDETVVKAGTWNLSTSQIYSENFEGYGWGAVSTDGFGIPYMIHPERLQFSVTGKKHMQVRQMRENLHKAADLVLDLHEAAAAAAASSDESPPPSPTRSSKL